MQLFQERLSEKVHTTILKGIGGFESTAFQRNLKEWHKRPQICLEVLKESSNGRFDSYSC